jgi:hypothetical protein
MKRFFGDFRNLQQKYFVEAKFIKFSQENEISGKYVLYSYFSWKLR